MLDDFCICLDFHLLGKQDHYPSSVRRLRDDSLNNLRGIWLRLRVHWKSRHSVRFWPHIKTLQNINWSQDRCHCWPSTQNRRLSACSLQVERYRNQNMQWKTTGEYALWRRLVLSCLVILFELHRIDWLLCVVLCRPVIGHDPRKLAEPGPSLAPNSSKDQTWKVRQLKHWLPWVPTRWERRENHEHSWDTASHE